MKTSNLFENFCAIFCNVIFLTIVIGNAVVYSIPLITTRLLSFIPLAIHALKEGKSTDMIECEWEWYIWDWSMVKRDFLDDLRFLFI